MNNKKRRNFNSSFKTKVVLESLKELQTMAQLSSKFEVHQNQISLWKKHFLEKAESIFDEGNSVKKDDNKDFVIDELYKKIGQLNMDLDWLKKKYGQSIS
jgi:transposase